MKWIKASERLPGSIPEKPIQRLPGSIPEKPIQIYYKYKSGDGKYWKGAVNTINQFLDFAKLAPTDEIEWLDESLPSGGKSAEEIEQWYYKWLSDRNKSGIVTENVLDMLKDFAASQQPVNDGWEGAHNIDDTEPPKQTP